MRFRSTMMCDVARTNTTRTSPGAAYYTEFTPHQNPDVVYAQCRVPQVDRRWTHLPPGLYSTRRFADSIAPDHPNRWRKEYVAQKV